MSDAADSRFNARQLRTSSLRLRESANAHARRSQQLKEGSAAILARAVILKTIFVSRRAALVREGTPSSDHLLFSSQFAPKDRSELLSVALQAAKRVAGTPLIALQLRDGDGALRIEAHAGLSAAFVRFFDGMAGPEYLRENGQVFVPEVAADALLAGTGSSAVLTDAGIRSIACTPIVHDSRLVIGLLSAYYREPTVAAAANLPGQQLVAARIAEWLQPELVER